MNVEIRLASSRRQKDGLALFGVKVPELGLNYDLDLPFKHLHERRAIPDSVAFDFLIIASLCYVIDKIVSRKNGADNWTRSFQVEFPVSDPKVWSTVVDDLEMAIGFLTGDTWEISFRTADATFFRRPTRRKRRKLGLPKISQASSVCLFSGGLDSLTGAINLLEGDSDSHVLLVGHYDAAGPRSQQASLFRELSKQYPRRVELLQTRVSHKPEAAQESSLRSRSLVFMALGVYAARHSGVSVPLYAPENGLIAINIPVTPSRAGSCSTRTMHPFFLAKLTTALSRVGLHNPILNPFELMTKGECIVGCLNQPLLKSIAELSVSCSHGTRRQNWIRKGSENCGYCMPCLFRRGALHSNGMDQGQSYGIDVCQGELLLEDPGDTADDLRAVVDYLYTSKSRDQIARELIAVAPLANVDKYAAMVHRGFDEIRTLFTDKATLPIQRAAGIKKVKQ